MLWKRLLTVFVALFCLFASSCPGSPQAAETPPTLIFIMDASGSMNGRLEGTVKIAAVRKVMTNLLAELPAELNVGLVAYGHRRKGDCSDVEMLVPPAVGGAGKTAEAIAALLPKGKTALAAAFAQIGTYAKQQEGGVTVVLVSDGAETCGGDPCNVAKKLRQQGIQAIHVVGYDVSGPAVDQLQCIAREGGGRYFQADSSEGLAAALGAVRDHVVTSAALPESSAKAAGSPAAAKTRRAKVTGAGTIVLAPAPWVQTPPMYWLLVDAETGQEIVRSKIDTARVNPGTYQIVWRQGEHGADEVRLSEVVRLESGDKITVPLETGLQLSVPKDIQAPFEWRLVNGEQETVAAFRGNLDPQLVPAGAYHLIWRQSEQGHSDVDLGQVVIQPGELKQVTIDHGITVQLPDWLKPPYYYSLLNEQGRSTRISQPGTQLLSAGVYQLSWKQTERGHSEIRWGEITVPEKGFTEIAIDSGLTILAGDSPPPYRIFAQDETGAWAEMADSWGPMPLPPGVYKLELQETQESSSRVTLVEELPIEKGQLLEIEL